MTELGLGAFFQSGSEKTYLLSWDAVLPPEYWYAVRKYITDARHITSWWHHLPFLILFRSNKTAHQLADDFKPFLPNGKFFVVEITPGNASGFLPAEAWAWLNESNHRSGGLLSALGERNR